MPSIKLRTCARTPISIGSNQSSKSWALVQAAECNAADFVLLLPMAWSPPAWQRRNRLGWTTRRLRHFQFLPTPGRHQSRGRLNLRRAEVGAQRDEVCLNQSVRAEPTDEECREQDPKRGRPRRKSESTERMRDRGLLSWPSSR